MTLVLLPHVASHGPVLPLVYYMASHDPTKPLIVPCVLLCYFHATYNFKWLPMWLHTLLLLRGFSCRGHIPLWFDVASDKVVLPLMVQGDSSVTLFDQQNVGQFSPLLS